MGGEAEAPRRRFGRAKPEQMPCQRLYRALPAVALAFATARAPSAIEPNVFFEAISQNAARGRLLCGPGIRVLGGRPRRCVPGQALALEIDLRSVAVFPQPAKHRAAQRAVRGPLAEL